MTTTAARCRSSSATARRAADAVERWEDMVLVGRLGRPHGLRGEVAILPETDFPEVRFAEGATLYAWRDGAVVTLEVDRSRTHAGRPLVGAATPSTRDGPMTVSARIGLVATLTSASARPVRDGTTVDAQGTGALLVDWAYIDDMGATVPLAQLRVDDVQFVASAVRGADGTLAVGLEATVDGDFFTWASLATLSDLRITARGTASP